MRHPESLDVDSVVRVVSPAGPVTRELLAPGLARLREWGLEVRVDDGVYDRQPPGYLAGTDEKRLERVQRALGNPDNDAIIFSRGGYGTTRWLADLAIDQIASPPPVIVGFSDLTALHLRLGGRHSIATLHGPVIKSLRLHETGSRSSMVLKRALFGRRQAPWQLDGLRAVLPGRVSGRLLGGNLTLVVQMLGSRFFPDLSDAVLLLEETGESDYRLDRALNALRLAPASRQPSGLVLGRFHECGGTYVSEPEIPRFVDQLAEDFDIPVVAGAPIGHDEKNVSVPMGLPVTLDADQGTLTFHDTVTRSPDADET